MFEIIRKDWTEHKRVLLGVFIFGLVLAALTIQFGRLSGDYSALRVILPLMMLWSPIAAWFVSGRIVTREMRNQTTLFLETLPIFRSEILIAKALAVWVHTWLSTLSPLALALILERDARQGLEGRVLLQIFASVSGYAFFWFAACFMFGLFGRYRLPAAWISLITLLWLEDQIGEPMVKRGLLELVSLKVATERALPTGPLLWTLGLSSTALLVGFGLGLLREGSIAAGFGRKMSAREKGYVAVLTLAVIMGFSTADKKQKPLPYDLQDADEIAKDGIRIEISRAGSDEMPRRVLGERLHAALAARARMLGIDALPGIHITFRTDLDPGVFELARLEKVSGVVARAAFPAGPADERALVSFLVREALAARSHGAVRRESARWVLDGFPRATEPPLPVELERAQYGFSVFAGEPDLDAWISFTERVGPEAAEAVAASIVRALVETSSSAGVEALRRVLAIDPPEDIRGWFARPDPKREIASALQRASVGGNEPLADLIARARFEVAARAAEPPEKPVEAHLEPLGRGRWRVAVSAETSSTTRLRVRFRVLDPPYVQELTPETFEVFEAAAGSALHFPKLFPPRTRLAWCASVWSDRLEAERGAGCRREVLR